MTGNLGSRRHLRQNLRNPKMARIFPKVPHFCDQDDRHSLHTGVSKRYTLPFWQAVSQNETPKVGNFEENGEFCQIFPICRNPFQGNGLG